MSDNQRGAVYMMCATFLFLCNDALSRSLAGELPLLQLLGMRSLGSALLLLPVLLYLRLPLWGYAPRDSIRLGLRCLSETAGAAFYVSALFLIPLADATAVLQVVPLSVTLAAALFLREPIGWRRLTAILIGFGGVMLIIRPGAAGVQPGALLVLGSVLMVTLRELVTRGLSGSVPTLSITFYTVLATAVLATGAMLIGGGEVVVPTGSILIRLGTGAVLLVGGFYFSVLAVRTGDLSVISPFRYSGLIFALVIGFAAFGEIPDMLTLLGAVIVVMTGLFTLWREKKLRNGAR